jgi:2-polyprenyl-6-hydroxyphenyl methylase/3-demethylubiquinone-9 3-methyltransferase
MRIAALLAKVATGDRRCSRRARRSRLATLAGARALGLDHAIGSLVAGKQADIVAVDLSALDVSPCYDPVSHLVHAVGATRSPMSGSRSARRVRSRADHGRRSGDRGARARVAGAPAMSRAIVSTRAAFIDGGNVDARELAKFAALAHNGGTRKARCSGPLHKMNPLRLEWIDRIGRAVSRESASSTSAAAAASSTEAMAELGAIALGIDLGDKALGVCATAQARVRRDRSTIAASRRRRSLSRHPPPSTWSPAWSFSSTSPAPAEIVAACAALAKPGGLVVFSTINRNAKAYALAVIGAEYVLGLLPKGTHDYARFLTPAELGSFARNAGLAAAGIAGIAYNPFNARSASCRTPRSTTCWRCAARPMADAPGIPRSARALPVDAVLFDLDGTLADTAPDLAAALNRVRVDRGLEPVPASQLRSSSSHGARGLIGTGMGVAPDHPDYLALRDAFLAHYESALCVDTMLFADVDALLARSRRARSSGESSRTRRRDTRCGFWTRWDWRARRRGRLRDTTPHTKPHPPRCSPRLRDSACPRRAASTSAMPSAMSPRVSPPECARSSRATATSTRARIRELARRRRDRRSGGAARVASPSSARTRAGVEEQPLEGLPSRIPATRTGWLAISGLTNATSTSSMPVSAMPFACVIRSPVFMPSIVANPDPSRTARPPATGLSSACQLSGRRRRR